MGVLVCQIIVGLLLLGEHQSTLDAGVMVLRPQFLLCRHILSLDDFLNQLDVILIDFGPPIHHSSSATTPSSAHSGGHLRNTEG